MAHPEILGFVVPREEGIPHALLARYLGFGFHVRFPSQASSDEPLYCNEGANRESQDVKDEQENCQKAEW
jgi:hypothetical protein